MPTTFPSVLLPTPLTRTLTAPCEVAEFLDGSEQRWQTADFLNSFAVDFRDVPAADLADIVTLFDTVKGAFDSSWSFVGPDGVTYPHLGFEQDDLAAVEATAGRYSFSVRFRQVLKDGVYSAVGAMVYPTLPNGAYTQRPFTAGERWLTTRNDLPSGARYAYSELAAARGMWTCEYPVLTSAEVGGRVDFFVRARGRKRGFSFQDPNPGGANHAHCRFDQDAIEVRCIGGGQWSTSLKIAEYVA